MSTLGYYAQSGQQLGPVEFSELQQMGAAGTLRLDDLVWSDGMPQWAAAATIPDLLPGALPGMAGPPAGSSGNTFPKSSFSSASSWPASRSASKPFTT